MPKSASLVPAFKGAPLSLVPEVEPSTSLALQRDHLDANYPRGVCNGKKSLLPAPPTSNLTAVACFLDRQAFGTIQEKPAMMVSLHPSPGSWHQFLVPSGSSPPWSEVGDSLSLDLEVRKLLEENP
ncbi:hypothetical protein KIL84_017082 [Mauremys mutica]|uniref:Uncharacterized protein n=1 Tax=Mauremys mutica TaxID=74926 RepID=A0A9D3X5F8_9SAUR|nr:hypothetical protein KIL84_017082 [Mauremys mutica]